MHNSYKSRNELWNYMSTIISMARKGWADCWRPADDFLEDFHFPQESFPSEKVSPHLVLCLPFSLTNVVSNDPFCFLTKSGKIRQLWRKTGRVFIIYTQKVVWQKQDQRRIMLFYRRHLLQLSRNKCLMSGTPARRMLGW